MIYSKGDALKKICYDKIYFKNINNFYVIITPHKTNTLIEKCRNTFTNTNS